MEKEFSKNSNYCVHSYSLNPYTFFWVTRYLMVIIDSYNSKQHSFFSCDMLEGYIGPFYKQLTISQVSGDFQITYIQSCNKHVHCRNKTKVYRKIIRSENKKNAVSFDIIRIKLRFCACWKDILRV